MTAGDVASELRDRVGNDAEGRRQADLLAARAQDPARDVWRGVPRTRRVRAAPGSARGPRRRRGARGLLSWSQGELADRAREAPALVGRRVLAALVVLHLVWRPWQSRYALPALPFAAVLLLAAWRPLRERSKPLAWALVGLLAVPGLSRSFGYAFEGLAAPRVELWPRSAAWLRDNVPAGERVTTLEPYLVALVSGREAAFPLPAASREAWVAELRRRDARWVFLRPREARNYLSKDARELMKAFDAWAVAQPPFARAFADDEEGVVVLRLD